MGLRWASSGLPLSPWTGAGLACVLGCGRALVPHPCSPALQEQSQPRHHPRPPRCSCGQVPTPQAFLVLRLTRALWPWLLPRLVEGMLLLVGGWVGLKTSGHFSPFLLTEAEVTDRTPAWPSHTCHTNWGVSGGMSLAPTPFPKGAVDWECGGLGHPISTAGAEA